MFSCSRIAFLVIVCLAGQLLAQDAAPAPSGADKINALLAEAQSLQGRKRYLDSFTKLDEAEKLAPQRPEIYNIRGAIYLAAQLRDIDKAKAQFTKARDLQPDAMPPYFNLAEVEFIREDWAAAEAAFREVITKFPKVPLSVQHLMRFKVIMSLVKQHKYDDAEDYAKTHFTFMDDSPAYYFTKAVIALEKKDEREGNDWLTKAQVIFKPVDTAAYIDSLMEAKYIDSIMAAKMTGESK